MARKNKLFVAPPAIATVGTATPDFDFSPSVDVGVNVNYNGSALDFSRWLNLGIDDWVWVCVHQLRAFRSGNTRAQVSIMTYGQKLPQLFKFLLSLNETPTPPEFAPRHVVQFIAWLKTSSGLSPANSVNVYDAVKSVLSALHRRNTIYIPPQCYPRNPFSNIPKGQRGHIPLSIPERSRLATAIRSDVIAMHHKEFAGTAIDALTVYVLALALRVGMNTTPVLELPRDALGPHPFMPNMRLLHSFKRRANATNHKLLRTSTASPAPTSIPMDGVALFEKVLELTAQQAALTSQFKDRLWLYSKMTADGNVVCSLSTRDLWRGITRFVKRNTLAADDGAPLHLNLSRLRKTMENRLWRLSNGDLFSVALLMGHHPKVADTTYLQVTPDMKRNATIVGEALPEMYRSGQKSSLEKTPVGSCKDGVYGDKAPRDGINSCGDFMSCLDCRSFAVVGSIEDLHRLFSFYWFLEIERERINSAAWREQYARMLSQIDAFTNANFDASLVREAKDLASREPHIFWKNYAALPREGVSANGV